MFKFFIEKIKNSLKSLATRSPCNVLYTKSLVLLLISIGSALVGYLFGRFTPLFDYLWIATAFLYSYMDTIITWTFLFFIIFCACKLLSKLPYRVLNVLQYVIPFVPFIVVYYFKSLETLHALEGEQDPKATNEDPNKNKLEGSEQEPKEDSKDPKEKPSKKKES